MKIFNATYIAITLLIPGMIHCAGTAGKDLNTNTNLNTNTDTKLETKCNTNLKIEGSGNTINMGPNQCHSGNAFGDVVFYNIEKMKNDHIHVNEVDLKAIESAHAFVFTYPGKNEIQLVQCSLPKATGKLKDSKVELLGITFDLSGKLPTWAPKKLAREFKNIQAKNPTATNILKVYMRRAAFNEQGWIEIAQHTWTNSGPDQVMMASITITPEGLLEMGDKLTMEGIPGVITQTSIDLTSFKEQHLSVVTSPKK